MQKITKKVIGLMAIIGTKMLLVSGLVLAMAGEEVLPRTSNTLTQQAEVSWQWYHTLAVAVGSAVLILFPLLILVGLYLWALATDFNPISR